MTLPEIAAVGSYAPEARIGSAAFKDALGTFDAAGIEQKAVPNADEDVLTMAYEAATRALESSSYEGSAVDYLAIASTTPPMAEEDLTARLASMLGVPANVTTRIATGSTRAGAQALDAALDAGPWGDNVGVVVASDSPRGAPDSAIEHAAGAGAVAFVLTRDGVVRVRDRASYVEAYPGTRFRSGGDDETTGLDITQYDRDAFRNAIGRAVDGLDIDVATVDAAAIQSPDGKLPYRLASHIGVDTEQVTAAETVSSLGDTGAASALLGAAVAFADGADDLLLAAYGSGAGADAFVLTAEGDVPCSMVLEGHTEISYADYLRRRGELSSGNPAGGGAYVSAPSWQRTLPQRHRLVAGRCSECGALNFPPNGACQRCTDIPGNFSPVELPGTGTVEAVTSIAQGAAPPEFVEQQARSGVYVSAIVSFESPDGESSVSVPVQVVSIGGIPVEIGSKVDSTIRRIYEQEGVIRYGLKARLSSPRE
jgi:hydroxymethylglutaryl-CoA synthase